MPRVKKPQPETGAAPRISVIDRRLQNPFGTPSREIPLAAHKRDWVSRTFSADPEHPNRHYDAVHRLGWEPLTPADLAVPLDTIGYVTSPAGHVVRGKDGAEILMGMTKENFERIRQRKAEVNLARVKPTKLRDDVAQATAVAHGSEAGDVAHKNFTARDIVEPVPDAVLAE